MGSISNFKAAINKGVARPNRYRVSIYKKSSNAGGIVIGNDNLTLLCEQAELPGMQFATNEDLLFGPIRKIPFVPVFNDLTLVYTCTEDMPERRYFDNWMESMYDRSSSSVGSPRQFLNEYYENYIGSIVIELLNNKDDTTYNAVFSECYPLEVVSQTLSYSETDTYLKLEVKIAFRYWERIKI